MSSTHLSVTAASARGVAGLLKSAEAGEDIVIARHGEPVAAIVSMTRIHEIRELESDLRDAALLLSRMTTDSGSRTSLDEVIEAFGFSRAELEAQISMEPQD
jgi:prevent-host-death family protein